MGLGVGCPVGFFDMTLGDADIDIVMNGTGHDDGSEGNVVGLASTRDDGREGNDVALSGASFDHV